MDDGQWHLFGRLIITEDPLSKGQQDKSDNMDVSRRATSLATCVSGPESYDRRWSFPIPSVGSHGSFQSFVESKSASVKHAIPMVDLVIVEFHAHD